MIFLIASCNSSLVISGILVISSVADVHVNVAFISIFVLIIVVVKFFLEFTKDTGDPFT